MIPEERIKELNRKPVQNKKYVLYWMQQAQRAEYNHALEYAVDQANKLKKPLIVCFGLTDDFPDANERHYYFMLEGLKETGEALAKRGMQMVIQHESPEIVATKMSHNACLLVTDRGYLKVQRAWRKYAADNTSCRMIQVETDVIVPVETVSSKEEYAAATIRKKIYKHLSDFLIPMQKTRLKNPSLNLRFAKRTEIDDTEKVIKLLKTDHTVPRTDRFRGGTSAAKRMLRKFIKTKLRNFAADRNDPANEVASCMSPYLHFGQISPLYIALQVNPTQGKNRDAYLEELVVRRELSMNFVFYNRDYDSFKGLPEWTRTTLRKHRKDRRQYTYTRTQLENCETHDPYWNACQKEMTISGKMHGYMRMYWGKKIIEWTSDPEQAFRTALYLNNKYELDGRDPNGFTGVAWCFGKHDRPWPERPIFGKVRYMNARGLERKFNTKVYLKRIKRII